MSAAKRDRPGFTPAQREAILSQGHTLLEAGAGSGKTTTLVGKILHALGADVVGERVARPCQLGEIAAITFTTSAAADLRRSLRDRLRAYAATDPDPRWRRLVYEVDRARIGTIHSFCGQILRELALREGLDPSFGVLDAGEAADLREQCARERVYAAAGAGDEEAGELVFQFTPGGAVRMVREAMEKGDTARLAYAEWCTEEGGARTAELRARVEALGGAWRPHDDQGALLAATVLRLAREAQESFDAALDRQGALDYDALIHRTRDLLQRSPSALAGLRRRLAWLFIDEFQDTDPAQRDIAYALCGIGESLAAAPTGGAKPEGCPSLCVVGDPKQSIYGFRRADVTLWNAVDRDFRELNATVVPLDRNFRSRAPLLGLVNGTFGGLMPAAGDERAPDYEVRYRPLTPARDYAGDDRLVELLELPEEGTVDVRRREEARRIARRIRAMVDDREPVVWDGKGDRKRVSWRDVALLFRSTGDVRLYEAELRKLEVPCFVAAGDGFYATREVRDVRLLLTALTDAHDDVAWVGLLRSPWVGLTDDALLRMRSERPGVPFSALLDAELPGTDGEALAFARVWIQELRRLRDRVPCAALVERALERSGYAAGLLYQQGGDVALANVRKLVRMADGRPEQSLAGFVDWLVERGESSAREAEAALHTAGEDVVTLTTVHGAKGLEWPVVFLCDLDREKPGSAHAPSFYFDAAHGIGIKLEDGAAPDGEQLCGAYECLQQQFGLRDTAEEKRVWYVASTRARDRLVLCAKPYAKPAPDAKKPPTPAQWLLAGLAVAEGAFGYAADEKRWTGSVVPELRELPAVEAPAPPRFADVAARAGVAAPLLRRILPAAPVAPLFRRSATELMTFAKSPDEHRRSYLLGLRLPYVGGNGSSGGNGNGNGNGNGHALDARTAGDVVHAIMEHDAELVRRDLDHILDRELASRLGADGAAALPRAARERLRRLVERTMSHSAVARLFAGTLVERELPFTWFLDVDGHVSVLHGAMDLVAHVDEALEILDFKTHQLRPGEEEQTAAGYHLQRDLYAAALHEVAGTPSAFSLFFPETGKEVRAALGADAVAAGRARVCAALRAVTQAIVPA